MRETTMFDQYLEVTAYEDAAFEVHKVRFECTGSAFCGNVEWMKYGITLKTYDEKNGDLCEFYSYAVLKAYMNNVK